MLSSARTVYLRRRAMLSLALLGGGLVAAPCQAIDSVFFIGNSLTWDAQPLGVQAIAEQQGAPLSVGYHIRSNSTLQSIWSHPDQTNVPPVQEFGRFPEALPTSSWDAITLQPFLGGTLAEDTERIKDFIRLAQQNPANADTRFYIYAAWPFHSNYQEDWIAEVEDLDETPTAHSRQYFEHLIHRVRAATSANVLMIPAGEVFFRLSQEVEAGSIAGFTNIADFYRDNIHMKHTIGRYTAGAITHAVLRSDDPAGQAVPEGAYGAGSPLFETAGLLDTVHQTIWDVVRAHPHSGVITADFNGDGSVDRQDLAIWQGGLGTPGAASLGDGDADRDGDVDGYDFLRWQQEFSAARGGSAGNHAVPEPTAALLLMLVSLGFLTRTHK